jgi:hypothetical protein
MKQLLILICSLFFSLLLIGQDSISSNKFSPAFNVSIGYLPKTYPIAPKSPGAVLAGAEMFWKFNGKDKWHQYYNYPRGGFELVFAYLGNTSELGSTIGLIPALEWHSKNVEKKWRFKMGFGVGYFDRIFDPISNPQNYYIGRHFMNMSRFSIHREVKISNKLAMRYGLSAIHASDGHTALPNVGLNMFTADVVINMRSSVKETSRLEYEDERKNYYTIKFGVGMHELGKTEKPVGGPSYPSYHLSGWYNRSLKHIHILQLGLILGYYTSFYDYIVNQEVYSSKQNLRSSTAILFAGHEFVFGKFGLSTQAGIYLYNPFYIKQAKLEGNWDNTSDKLESVFTNRLGLNYYPFKKSNSLNKLKGQLGLSIYIKTNLAQADLFEYALSFTF